MDECTYVSGGRGAQRAFCAFGAVNVSGRAAGTASAGEKALPQLLPPSASARLASSSTISRYFSSVSG